uniref:Peptide methionine sulfoxide reductase B1ic n=1 Tax=Rhizophora mucronata TaxID=61149 RepID=A0A2P2JYV0_RHIMU
MDEIMCVNLVSFEALPNIVGGGRLGCNANRTSKKKKLSSSKSTGTSKQKNTRWLRDLRLGLLSERGDRFEKFVNS